MIIRTERLYKLTKHRIQEDEKKINEYKKRLKEECGLSDEKIEFAVKAIGVLASECIRKDLELFEKAKRNNIKSCSLDELGRYLVAWRLKSGLNQNQLANKRSVRPSAVCRDEAEDYKNASLTQLNKIADCLDLEITCNFKPRK